MRYSLKTFTEALLAGCLTKYHIKRVITELSNDIKLDKIHQQFGEIWRATFVLPFFDTPCTVCPKNPKRALKYKRLTR